MLKLEEMSSQALRQVLDGGVRTVVVPFGSVEDHGGHLPLGCDALLAEVVGESVAERLDAVMAPTMRVGCADQHMSGTGTLTLPAEALADVAFHLARSLFVHGFRVIALVSAHGGNRVALEEAARRLNEQFPDLVACAPRGEVGPKPGAHSGTWLTSVMLVVRPDLVDIELADEGLDAEVRAATPEVGAENLERFVSAIVRQVREEPRSRPGGGGS